MEDENSNQSRRMSSRTRKMATKMSAALASTDNRNQAALARLEALENDNAAIETVEVNSDDDASLDDEDQVYSQKKQSKGTKRTTRQAKALANARKAPKHFLNSCKRQIWNRYLHMFPTYMRAAVGPPSSTSRRHFCTVCGYAAHYTCVNCGMRFLLHSVPDHT